MRLAAGLLIVGLARLSCLGADTPRSEPPPGLRLKGDEDFREKALAALERIHGTKIGTRLLGELAATGSTVTLRFGGQETFGAVIMPTGGGDSVVLWDPDYELDNFPAFVFLYHELVHALHEARHSRLPGKAEERRAAGIKEFADYPLSENALRRELKLPLRRGISREGFPELRK